jgi:TolB-like protein
MFTDIVGYTALMGSDEDKAFQVLRKNRHIQQTQIIKHNGEWLKEMGDGILAQFESASDSVQCAIEIQRKAREELGAKLRIGIHLGDVTFENNDVFGDGVNIASRIQSIADPGGIFISEALQNSIPGNSDIQAKYLAQANLKNVSYPIKVYAIQNEGLPKASSDMLQKRLEKARGRNIYRSPILWVTVLILLVVGSLYIRDKISNLQIETPTVLVLPPDDYTNTDTLDYLMAGIHSSLISDIGMISSLRVPSKRTADFYKNSGKSMAEIATEANVDYIIEPSVMCVGDSICIGMRMVKVDDVEEQVWLKDYYVDVSEIQNWFRGTAKEISRELQVELTPREEGRLAKNEIVNPEAQNAIFKGNFYLGQFTPESIELAGEYFQKAIDIDPYWWLPYLSMMTYWEYVRQMGKVPDSIATPKINEYRAKAQNLGPDDPRWHLGNYVMSIWTEFDWYKGEQELLNWLELYPNEAWLSHTYAMLLIILKRDEEAMKQAEIGLDLDPLDPMALGRYAIVAANIGENEKAIEKAEKALSYAPKHGAALFALTLAYLNKGDYQTALNYMTLANHFDEETRRLIMDIYDDKGYKMAALKIAEEIEKAGLNDPTNLYIAYALAGEDSRAMDALEQGFKDRNPGMPSIGCSMYSREPFKVDDPRFNELLTKMNLPLE